MAGAKKNRSIWPRSPRPQPAVRVENNTWGVPIITIEKVNGKQTFRSDGFTSAFRSVSTTTYGHGFRWREMLAENPVLIGNLFFQGTEWRINPPWYSLTAINRLAPYDTYSYGTNLSLGVSANTSDVPDSVLNGSRAKSLSKLVSKYRERTRALQSIVMVRELRENLQLIMSPAKSIFNIFKKWIRAVPNLTKQYAKLSQHAAKRNKKFPRYLKWMANKWLEYSFGLKPLIADAKQAAKKFNDNMNWFARGFEIIVVRPDSALKAEQFPPVVHFVGPEIFGRTYSYTTRGYWSARTKYRSAFTHVGNGPAANAELWGYDPTNIATSVWEIIPFSFILDYFTNIGDVIDAWSVRNCFGNGVQETLVADAWTEKIGPVDHTPNSLGTYNVVATVDVGEFRNIIRRVTRQSQGQLPWVPFQWQMPGMSTKWINLAALGITWGKRH